MSANTVITSSSIVVGTTPRISAEQFAEILLDADSPAAPDAFAIYDAIIAEGVDPAFMLGVFKKESQYATDPKSIVVRYQSFNMGNCRSSRIGVTDTVTDPVRGTYVKYKNWASGAQDAAHRLVDTNFNYYKAGATTIEKIINIWAPGDDGNDPTGYANTVVTLMNGWISSGGSMADLFPTAADLGLPANMVRIHKAADIGPWRPLSQVKWDIGHDTQGGFIGSESTLTADDGNVASCHALIDVTGFIVLSVPLDFTAWTPGNDYYAERSINIELVGFQTGPYTEAQYRSYAAYYRWAVAQGCPIANSYIGKKGLASGHLGHEDVPNPFGPGYGGRSGHTDPGAYFLWDKFVLYCGGSVAVFDPNPKKLNVGPGMLDFAKLHQLKFIVAEQFFSPNSNQPGLGQMSRAWAQDGSGVTFVLMASELVELAKSGEATPWKIERLELV
jgi:hypothetical protein